jgi:hypothetical protein
MRTQTHTLDLLQAWFINCSYDAPVWLWLFEGFCCFKFQHFEREMYGCKMTMHVSCAHKYFLLQPDHHLLLFLFFYFPSHLLIYFLHIALFVYCLCPLFLFYVGVSWFVCSTLYSTPCVCLRSAMMWN